MKLLDVYFDYMSPFAYIAAQVLPERIAEADVALRWKPIELMKLSNYANGLPYSPSKRRYVAIDAARSAQFHGVEIRVPKPHPIDSLSALRLAVSAIDRPEFPELHNSLFRAAWRDRQDISKREVLSACVEEARGSVDDWMAASASAETQGRLDRFTAEAESRGVFGVPAMFLDSELFWGLDSLPILDWRFEHPPPAS